MKRLATGLGKFGIGLVIGLVVAGLYILAIVVAPGGAAFWIASLGPVALIGFLLGFRLPDDILKRWSKSHGVPITPENRDLIVRHLTRGRRIRTAGATLGFAGYIIVQTQVGQDEVSWGVLRSIFFGYLIGAGIAEVWALRLRAQGTRAASLAPRQLRDYLPRPATYLLRAATAATVGLAIAWESIPSAGRVAAKDARPDLGWAIAWAGVAAAAALFVEFVIRRIVRRPQPAVSDELIRVDDAIRSSSIHQLAGAGLALVFGILSARMNDLNANTDQNLSDLFGMLALFTGIASLVAWLHLGVDQSWVVRRKRPEAKAAA